MATDTDKTPDNEPSGKRRWLSMRNVLLLIVFLLIGFELWVMFSLEMGAYVGTEWEEYLPDFDAWFETSGWKSTVAWGGLIAAVSLALLPLIAAISLLLVRGRKFSLRSMMIATALVAVFVSLFLYPYLQAKERRRGVIALEAAGILYQTVPDRASHQPPPERPAIERDIRFWMKPFIGDSFPSTPDLAVRGLALRTDKDIQLVASLIDRFPNLDSVILDERGISKEGFQLFAEFAPRLYSLEIHTVQGSFPEGWGKSLHGVGSLEMFNIMFAANAKTRLSGEQLADIASIDGLEHVSLIGIDFKDSDFRLGQSPNLREVTIHDTNLDAAGCNAILAANPNLRLHIYPTPPRPEDLLRFIGSRGGLKIRMTYNKDRTTWEYPQLQRETVPNPEFIDTGYPIVVTFQSSSDDLYEITPSADMFLLSSQAERYGLVVSSSDSSASTTTITLVEDTASQAKPAGMIR